MESESRFHPNSDQLALAHTIEESLIDMLPLARLHRGHDEDAGTWAKLEEIGIFGITNAEGDGGSGLGAAEEALIVIALGRRLAAPSVLATIGAAHLPCQAHVQGARVAAGYIKGERILIVADIMAEQVLIRTAAGADLCPAPQRTSRTDDFLWHADLRQASDLAPAVARLESAHVLRLRLIDAAALAGIAQAALDMSVAYAQTREQFGRPIGSFQAVKHHCSNMAMAARCARDQTAFAAVAIDERRYDAALQVESALYVAGEAALANAGKNIQIHGGIGFSGEAYPHLLLKRAQLLLAVAGGLEAAILRLADIKTDW